MTAQSWLLFAVYLVVLLAAVKPLGLYMAKLMEAPRWQPLAHEPVNRAHSARYPYCG